MLSRIGEPSKNVKMSLAFVGAARSSVVLSCQRTRSLSALGTASMRTHCVADCQKVQSTRLPASLVGFVLLSGRFTSVKSQASSGISPASWIVH
jgi:hypothetical protein